MDVAVKKRLSQAGLVLFYVALIVGAIYVIVSFVQDPRGSIKDLTAALRNID